MSNQNIVKKTNRLKYLKIGLLTVLFLFGGCKSFNHVRIGDIQGLSIYEVSTRYVRFNLEVPIVNPKRIAFRIVDMDLKLKFDDKYLGKVTNLDTIKVPGKSDELYNVTLQLQLPGLLGAMNALSVLNEDAGNISLSGDLKIKYLLLASKEISVREQQYVDLSGF